MTKTTPKTRKKRLFLGNSAPIFNLKKHGLFLHFHVYFNRKIKERENAIGEKTVFGVRNMGKWLEMTREMSVNWAMLGRSNGRVGWEKQR